MATEKQNRNKKNYQLGIHHYLLVNSYLILILSNDWLSENFSICYKNNALVNETNRKCCVSVFEWEYKPRNARAILLNQSVSLTMRRVSSKLFRLQGNCVKRVSTRENLSFKTLQLVNVTTDLRRKINCDTRMVATRCGCPKGCARVVEEGKLLISVLVVLYYNVAWFASFKSKMLIIVVYI